MNEHPAHGELRPVTEHASVLLANNPSPMTLEGTNSWVVRAPGSADCVVIDPGPEDTEHLQRLADCGPVSLVLLTHHHGDHTEGVAEFRKLTGAPVRALDPELCAGAEPLADDEVVSAAGVRLRVLATPGHTRDSVCFALEQSAEPVVFTGDTVLGRGTTVIADPDGHLGSYLSSLRRLAELPPGVRALPGHGPERPDVRVAAVAYLQHREQRLDQVRAAARQLDGEITARRIVEVVYADVDRSVWPAAEWSVRAQLTYLRETGEL